MVAIFAFMPILFLLPVSQAGAGPAPQSSPPPLPASFYGILQADTAASPPSDLAVSASINEIQYAATAVIAHEGQRVYALKVPADNPATEEIEGGRPGDTVTFLVNGRAAATAPWQGGTNTQVDLALEPLNRAQAEGAQPPGLLPFIAAAVLLLLMVAIVIWRRRRAKPELASDTAVKT